VTFAITEIHICKGKRFEVDLRAAELFSDLPITIVVILTVLGMIT
jgi:hypothetical protein